MTPAWEPGRRFYTRPALQTHTAGSSKGGDPPSLSPLCGCPAPEPVVCVSPHGAGRRSGVLSRRVTPPMRCQARQCFALEADYVDGEELGPREKTGAPLVGGP